MTYSEIQDIAIEKYKINIVNDSKCWSRTHAHCDGSRRVCKWKRAESYASTFTLFHEIGHIEANIKGMLRCEEESTATQWAVDRFRELGIPIKRHVLNSYKEYIRRTFNRGVRRGMKRRIKSSLLM